MRVIILLSFGVLLSTGTAAAQAAKPDPQTTKPQPQTAKPAPPAAKPVPQTTKPQTAKPAAPRTTQPAGRSGVAMTVVDARGATIPDVKVDMTGPTPRDGVTDDSGQLNFPGLQPGTYRLRFSGDAVTTFEREVALRAGQIEKFTVTLNPAPPPPDPPPPAPVAPPPPAPAPAVGVGPAGDLQSLVITDVLEKEFVARAPRRESLLSCSGNMRTTMIQLNEPLPERLYAGADAVYYVLGGEGTMRVDGRDNRLVTNSYVSVPRGTLHAFTRRGNRPLILLAVLSGEPCEEAR
jgi:hypothetical protein